MLKPNPKSESPSGTKLGSYVERSIDVWANDLGRASFLPESGIPDSAFYVSPEQHCMHGFFDPTGIVVDYRLSDLGVVEKWVLEHRLEFRDVGLTKDGLR